jgi:hypothetical protein
LAGWKVLGPPHPTFRFRWVDGWLAADNANAIAARRSLGHWGSSVRVNTIGVRSDRSL